MKLGRSVSVDGRSPWKDPPAGPLPVVTMWMMLDQTWSRSKYEADVLKVWNAILMGRGDTPRTVIKHLGNKEITIVPGLPKEARATAYLNMDATARGYPERDCGLFAGWTALNYQIGTGRGSEVEIVFTPDDWKGKTGPGRTPDEVLFHELIHALRMTTGNNQCLAWTDEMTTEEEVIAIAITNMYSSERGRPLRNDHASSIRLADPESWIKQHSLPLIRFWNRQRALGNELARSKAPFNPFRELSPVPFHRT